MISTMKMIILFYLMPVKTSFLKALNVSFGKFTFLLSSLFVIAPTSQRILVVLIVS